MTCLCVSNNYDRCCDSSHIITLQLASASVSISLIMGFTYAIFVCLCICYSVTSNNCLNICIHVHREFIHDFERAQKHKTYFGYSYYRLILAEQELQVFAYTIEILLRNILLSIQKIGYNLTSQFYSSNYSNYICR